jgi:hypothetical protein
MNDSARFNQRSTQQQKNKNQKQKTAAVAPRRSPLAVRWWLVIVRSTYSKSKKQKGYKANKQTIRKYARLGWSGAHAAQQPHVHVGGPPDE